MVASDRVLFVDDEAAVRTAFARSLRHEGVDIDTAEDGTAALRMLNENQYAVIATDYCMPGMDGLALVERMRAIQPDATYLLVSGECDLELAVAAVNEHNMSFVIPKPWNLLELSTAIRRSIEAHWERSAGRTMQKNFVDISRHLDAQKARLDAAMAKHEARLAETLLDTLTMRGHETRAHCRRIAAYSRALAEAAGVTGPMLMQVEYGALLHDIGIIAVPDAILLKATALTPAEVAVIHTHPTQGGKLLGPYASLTTARQIVEQHHERWDGSGYPHRLVGDQICIGARAVAVADTLDALLTGRSYRDALRLDQARQHVLRCAQSFDPMILEAFASIPADSIELIREAYPDERLAA